MAKFIRGLFKAKAILAEEQQRNYLTHRWDSSPGKKVELSL